jgi:hypothetical protein
MGIEMIEDGRRRRIVSGVLSVALACAAGSACGKSLSAQHPGGDPDGRLLAALSSVVAAAPSDAQIAYVHKRASRLGSCDGMAGTWGWTNVGFEAGFASSENALDVIASADDVLTRQGWTREELGQRDGPEVRISTWTKSIPPAVDLVRLRLSNNEPLGGRTSNNTPRVGWAFKTSAIPPGYPVRGC